MWQRGSMALSQDVALRFGEKKAAAGVPNLQAAREAGNGGGRVTKLGLVVYVPMVLARFAGFAQEHVATKTGFGQFMSKPRNDGGLVHPQIPQGVGASPTSFDAFPSFPPKSLVLKDLRCEVDQSTHWRFSAGGDSESRQDLAYCCAFFFLIRGWKSNICMSRTGRLACTCVA
jgi:hypothetical protein